jgi:hypothetical protein
MWRTSPVSLAQARVPCDILPQTHYSPTIGGSNLRYEVLCSTADMDKMTAIIGLSNTRYEVLCSIAILLN